MKTRRFWLSALAIGAAAVACGQASPPGHPANPAEVPAPLNGLTAAQVVDDFARAGLPTLNKQDITTTDCPKLGCVQAIRTDTVTVLKFPATGLAQRYIESERNDYQIEDLVLAFSPTVSADVKRRYEQVVERAAV
jgi:hypothetical protein